MDKTVVFTITECKSYSIFYKVTGNSLLLDACDYVRECDSVTLYKLMKQYTIKYNERNIAVVFDIG